MTKLYTASYRARQSPILFGSQTVLGIVHCIKKLWKLRRGKNKIWIEDEGKLLVWTAVSNGSWIGFWHREIECILEREFGISKSIIMNPGPFH